MSQYRFGYRAPYRDSTERGPNGRLLCRMCGKEVPKGRRTWCSQECVDEYQMRAGHGIRHYIKARDKGVCAICGLDTGRLEELEAVLRNPANYIELRPGPNRARRKRLLCEDAWTHQEWKAFLAQLGIDGGSHLEYWHADHIVPVCEGGGQCTWDNLRTLCVACHKAETRSLWQRRGSYSDRKEVTMSIQAVIYLDQIPKGADRIRLMKGGKALEINLHRLFDAGKTTDTLHDEVVQFIDAVAGEDITGEAARDKARELQDSLKDQT